MRYVVLRDLQRTRQFDPFMLYARTFDRTRERPDLVTPPVPRIDVETIDVHGRNELARDPEVVALTAAMPTRLIEPFNSASQDDTGDSWGVGAVGAAASSRTGADIVVSVLDTGIDSAHAAFTELNIIE